MADTRRRFGHQPMFANSENSGVGQFEILSFVRILGTTRAPQRRSRHRVGELSILLSVEVALASLRLVVKFAYNRQKKPAKQTPKAGYKAPFIISPAINSWRPPDDAREAKPHG